MANRARLLLIASLVFLCSSSQLQAVDARFDLVGPRIDVRVTRDGVTLPIASVPNLKAGDKLWIHPDLPATQSVKYLVICVFLRGTTNPPPPEWFTRIDASSRKVREEGTFITVPAEAQQALLFMAPETGGDFSTLRSAVTGRPGAFVRASQDLIEAGFEQARIEKYIAGIRRVPPSDPAELQKHSDLLSRTLALKPQSDCFKRPADTQFTCLTQSGTQVVLDDGHGQNIVSALSNGPGSDLIQQASYTQAFGAGLYSAYVGAIVDVVRIMANLHTAQYQYIPAISFPQAEQMNLRLNTPPSFHNPKSVLVIALPSVQAAAPPPLRPADANHVACLIKPSVVLPIEGAPLVFSQDFAHDLVLHLNTPPGAPAEPDVRLIPDAYYGGLVLQQTPQHHVPLRDPLVPAITPTNLGSPQNLGAPSSPAASSSAKVGSPTTQSVSEPVTLTGTIQGRWGFDAFTGPTLPLQQQPGTGWHIVTTDNASDTLIAGHSTQLLLASTGTACVHTITAEPSDHKPEITLAFKPELPPSTPHPAEAPAPDAKPDPTLPLNQVLALTLPPDHNITPGDLHLAIQQFDQPKSDEISARTFSEPAAVTAVELHAGDKAIDLTGTHLNEITQLTLGDLNFTPASETLQPDNDPHTLLLSLPPTSPAPPTHAGDLLTARIVLRDGRSISVPLTVAAARPSITLLSKSTSPLPNSIIALPNPDDLPISSSLTFTLKTATNFPRNGQIEIETLDGTLRTVLTLAPSGGLLLQDPRTLVATLDPLRSFGPSAFGALHLRAVFPDANRSSRQESHSETQEKPAAPAVLTSDWVPLVTLVRLPTLSQLQCPTDDTQPCSITGSNLFLVQAISANPDFNNPVPVPDGYTGTTLTLPHLAAGTLFFKLRDDPSPIDSASFPVPPPPAHTHHSSPAAKQTSPAPSPGSSSTTTTAQSTQL
jgi:hypothetical protein